MQTYVLTHENTRPYPPLAHVAHPRWARAHKHALTGTPTPTPTHTRTHTHTHAPVPSVKLQVLIRAAHGGDDDDALLLALELLGGPDLCMAHAQTGVYDVLSIAG